MTKFKNEELIKDKIMDGCRRGICDSEGNSISDENGKPKAPPKKMRATSIYKKGKWVKEI